MKSKKTNLPNTKNITSSDDRKDIADAIFAIEQKVDCLHFLL
jgi:hypothetical protein